jgi:hypothetical protein
MLDGAEPDQPEEFEARRLILLARVAQKFGQLPSVVARVLDDDPSLLDLYAYEALQYEDTKNIFDSAKDKSKLEAFAGDPLMKRVEDNTFAIHRERLAARRTER